MSAASGLVRRGGGLYVIADDEHHLAVFPPGRLIRLLPGELPENAARKAAKPDFEALVALPEKGVRPLFAGMPGAERFLSSRPLIKGSDPFLLALGSGSTAARERGVLVALDGREPVVVDLAPLYARLREHVEELNVEGACMLGAELVLLLRGANLLARVDLAAAEVLAVRAYDLPGGLGFTDADALPDGSIVFSAAAEDTPNAYDDGPVEGSAIGVIGPGGELQSLEWLEPRGIKVEGIAAAGDELLMVCDPDDRQLAAPLLTTRVPRRRAPA